MSVGPASPSLVRILKNGIRLCLDALKRGLQVAQPDRALSFVQEWCAHIRSSP
jgi:hypothetical protein